MENSLRVFVATHKPTLLYGNTECYQFIHVGAKLHPDIHIEGALKDDSNSDNISNKNHIYCELTGLYYIWKHVKNIDITGLVHYRRYLGHKTDSLHPTNDILSKEEITKLLKNNDLIIGNLSQKKGERSGYFVIKEDIPEFCFYRLVKPAIQALYPDYLEDFEKEFQTKELAAGNIMICRKQLFDKYCEWLFDILFKVEEQLIDSPFGIAPRELGYFSEYLMNVWIRKNKLKVIHKPVLFIDDSTKLSHRIRLYMNVLGLRKVVKVIDSIYGKINSK